MASLHPKNGARVVLERRSADAEGARYHVTVYEPGQVSHQMTARLAGHIEHGDWSSDPPEWTLAFVDRLLKTLANKHAAGTWPRKVTRWRERK